MSGGENKIHPEVLNFHEVVVAAIALIREGNLTRKDVQWLRIDAGHVLTVANQLLDVMEVPDDAR